MLSLPNVTLCCVDTAHHVLSVAALRACLSEAQYAKTIFVTDKPDYLDAGWELHRIAAFEDYRAYNRFMLKSLKHHVETDFVLSVQFDGFVINASRWTDEFLQYDYIGAPWPAMMPPYNVGTGGFSLRSRRLLEALQDDAIQLSGEGWNQGEDYAFCASFRTLLETRYGIRFAPPELASRFCHENGPALSGAPFGFHGLRLFADLYDDDTFPFIVEHMQPYLLRHPMTAFLAAQFAERKRWASSELLLKRIAQYQTLDVLHEKFAERNAPPQVLLMLDTIWERFITKEKQLDEANS